eukprot:6187154-Pleurochrysis_carterae.AAC.1
MTDLEGELMRDLLSQLAVDGFLPIENKLDPCMELMCAKEVAGIVKQAGLTPGLPQIVCGDAKLKKPSFQPRTWRACSS